MPGQASVAPKIMPNGTPRNALAPTRIPRCPNIVSVEADSQAATKPARAPPNSAQASTAPHVRTLRTFHASTKPHTTAGRRRYPGSTWERAYGRLARRIAALIGANVPATNPLAANTN